MWSLVIAIGIIVVINYLLKKMGFLGFRYIQKFDKQYVEVSEKTTLETTFENDKWLPILHLLVTQQMGTACDSDKVQYCTYLMPKQRLVRKQEVTFSVRGKYQPDLPNLAIGDFLGLKETKCRVLDVPRLVVLPVKRDLEKQVTLHGSTNGSVSVKRWILDDPLMPLGIREYTGYEPQKYIHWGSSARLGKLMVKQFDFTQDTDALVLLNMEIEKPKGGYIDPKPGEDAIVNARSFVEFFEENHFPYAFISNNKDGEEKLFQVNVGLGERHLMDILRHLGEVEFKRTFFIENIINTISEGNRVYQTVVLVTPKILESYIEPINQLSKHVPKLVVCSVDPENFNKLNPRVVKLEGGAL